MHTMRRCALLLVALLVVACADDDGEGMEEEEADEDAGLVQLDDAGSDARVDGHGDARVDSALPDEPDAADELDAAQREPELDASTPDAEVMDAGSDAGKDSGASDAGSDAGRDSGVIDAGSAAGKDASVDASVVDASVPDASAVVPVVPNTFSSVYAILAGNCSDCHGNNGSMSFSTKQRAYDELVGGPTGPALGAAEGQMCSGVGRRRVIALDPDNSLIIQKLSGTPPCGNPMPPGDMLTSAQVAEIRAWIVAGALNN